MIRSKSKPMKIENLYHRFIAGNELEKAGMTAFELALILQRQDYIFFDPLDGVYEENWKEKNWCLKWPNIFNIISWDKDWHVKILIERNKNINKKGE